MKPCIHSPLLAAVLAAALALGGTAALARTLRHRAAALSHEQPTSTKVLLSAPTTPQQLTEGAHHYFNSCAHCHGNDARGDEGPDLHGLDLSDRRIATVIKHGIKGEMPSFAQKHDDAQILSIIAYLRTLK